MITIYIYAHFIYFISRFIFAMNINDDDDDEDTLAAYFFMQQTLSAASAACMAVNPRPPSEVFYNSEDDDDVRPLQKRRRHKKRMAGLRLIMADQCRFAGGPTQPLSINIALDKLFRDPNRNYCKIILGLFGWEFFSLHGRMI